MLIMWKKLPKFKASVHQKKFVLVALILDVGHQN